LIQQTEQRRFRSERDDRERGKRGARRDHRREEEQQRVGGLRTQLLLEKQLDDIGKRLQRPLEPDAVRPHAVLNVGAHLALQPHHEGGREHEHVEDDEYQPEVGDDLGINSHK
jgi:hypothetical protein